LSARAWALVAAAGLALLGCKSSEQGGSEAGAAKAEAGEVEAAAPIPTTEAGFLAELVPLPEGAEAIAVEYEITGPALVGEMTTTITAGGKRRDDWELRSTTSDTTLRAAGSTIVNPSRIWTASEGSGGELRQNPLAELAAAYMRLEPEARAGVVESIRAWHRLLAEQRERERGRRAEVLGVSCLQTRIAAQNVCMWEETGLLLRYEGSAFTIEAKKIDRDPKLEAGVFELPPEAAELEVTPVAEQDYDQILQDIAAGSYGSVSALVLGSRGLPSLSLPKQG
jgi:hypothetical protein